MVWVLGQTFTFAEILLTVLSTRGTQSERRQTSRPSLITGTLTPPGPKNRIEYLEHIGSIMATLLFQSPSNPNRRESVTSSPLGMNFAASDAVFGC